MKRSLKPLALVLVPAILAIMAWVLIVNPGLGLTVALFLFWGSFTLTAALIPALLVSVFTGFKNFVFAWAGTWLGAVSGLMAGGIAWNILDLADDPGSVVVTAAFTLDTLGGAVMGANFKGFKKEAKVAQSQDLGYVHDLNPSHSTHEISIPS
ncbi:MAG: hypothetical protein H6581_27050 [Bacteroidia bacterium]|nr:hypothetical protein [Bacteroidia bacterium]